MDSILYDKEYFTPMELVNTQTGEVYKGTFSDRRIYHTPLPEGLYIYDCRHGDDDWATPITVEADTVIVNYAGAFITDKPIEFPEPHRFVQVKVADWD